MQKTLVLVDDPLFGEHLSPAGHPERPERLHAARAAIARSDFDLRRTDLATRAATDEQLVRVHHETYLEQLGQAAGQVGHFDEDTFYSPQSVDAARAAAGAAIVITDALRMERWLEGNASSPSLRAALASGTADARSEAATAEANRLRDAAVSEPLFAKMAPSLVRKSTPPRV